VLFDLRVALGGVVAIALALVGVRYPIARVRAGIAVVAGGLLHAWLGVPALLDREVASAALALDEVTGRSAVLASTVLLGAIVLSTGEEAR
jgi:hypothetical protein